MSFSPGQDVTKSATFILPNGDRVDPDPIHVDVVSPSNVIVVDNAVPTRVSLGYFRYTYTLPNDAEYGTWRIEWRGVVNGVPVFGYDEIDVQEFVDVTSDFERLRRMVGERIPVGKTADDTFFSDAEIEDLLIQGNQNFNRAAMFGWLAKMAEFAKLIDRNTSGADMPLSQMYKHAALMFKHYSELAGEDVVAIAGRVVGRAINMREDNSCPRVMTGATAYRTELHNMQARQLMMRDNPDLLEIDASYPQPGQVAT